MNVIDKVFKVFYKYHTPKAILNNKEIEMIKHNGLVHFTKYDNKDGIKKYGILGTMGKHIIREEEEFTWFYIYNNTTFSEKLDIVRSKGKRKSYDAFVIIKNLSDEQISKLRIRRETDEAIIFPGTLKTNDITIKKLYGYPLNTPQVRSLHQSSQKP